MNILQTFTSSFMYANRLPIAVSSTLVLPLTVNSILFSIKAYQNKDQIKRNFTLLSRNIKEAFTKIKDESQTRYLQRLLENISKIAVKTGLVALSIAVPFTVLSTAFAIPAALIAIHALGRIDFWSHKALHAIKSAKNYFHDAFTQRNTESVEAFKTRRYLAIKQIVKISLIAAAALAGAAGVIYFATLLSHARSIWSLYDLLPNQTPTVVFLEYASVGLLHLIQAITAWKMKHKANSLFHVSSALASIAFPLQLIATSAVPRLHHSFIGLLFQLAPWNTLKILGTVINLDALLNATILPSRSYDYMNVLLDCLPLVLTSEASITLAEDVSGRLLASN